MILDARTVAGRLGELREAGTLDSRYLRQCEDLCTILEEECPDGRLPFPKALGALYPDAEPETVMEAFKTWRSRLNRKLQEAGRPFQLIVSQSRRLPVAERMCWFEGEDRTGDMFGSFSGAEARLDAAPEPTRGIPTIWYFVSYAHADRAPVESLVKRLDLRLSRIDGFKFQRWRDTEALIPGENIQGEVENGIDLCHIGLQMVSYPYMDSAFVRDHERPRFASGDRCKSDSRKRLAFPIALDTFDFETFDLEEFGPNLLFLHDGKGYRHLQEETCDEFADACVKKILQATRRYLGGPDDDPPSRESLTDEAMWEVVSNDFASVYVATRGHETRMELTYGFEPDDSPPETPGIPVLDHLLHWATMRRTTPLFALLGDYGMGKTVNCKQLTLALLARRRHAEVTGEPIPVPVYLDMRYARGLFRSETTQQGTRRFEHVEVDDLVNAIFRESWKSRETPDAADLRRLIVGGNVLIVFDGFDEVAVHLHPDEAQSLIRTMWSLLPQDAFSPDVERRPSGAASVQMLISCRTHYFRDVTQQTNLFTGHQRDLERGADLYDAMILLPFTDDQIESFLTAKVGNTDAARRALDTIRSVHDLPELARRPVLLDRICGQLERIEALAVAGEGINAARLYDLLVGEWLARDDAKHTFDVEIKKSLMGRLAGAMWRSDELVWPAGKVEAWLDGVLRDDPRLLERYAGVYSGRAREILYEDLRTSTFVVRPDGEGFRFAHTSMHEYFLSRHLFETLRDGDANVWEGISPSRECLQFLIETACDNAPTGEKRRFFDELGKLLRHGYLSGVSEVAFRIALEAQRRGEPAAPRGRYRLEGAKLTGWEIVRKDSDAPIDLTGSDFSGAILRNVRFGDVVARDCVFDGANLDFVSFERVQLSGASFEGVRAMAGNFRHCPMKGFQDNGASWRKTTFLHCRDLQELEGSDEGSGGPLVVPGDTFAFLDAQCGSPRLQAQLGPFFSTGGCAFSPDGTRGVFGGYGSTLCLWHVETGEKIAVLQGHKGRVCVCAFSPDGGRVVSGSEDGTLRLWDSETGKGIAVLRGHSGPVRTCAISPDGARIVSGSDDRTLRMWNGANGEEITVLRGHFRPVRTCAISPDGTRIISGSNDRTLRLWNGETGEEIAVLRGHTQRVGMCVYGPDGTRLVSGSDDGTLRLWDGETGEAIKDFQCHPARCPTLAFSADGTRLISGSGDGTLHLCDGATGEETTILKGHTEAVSACAFSPDGTLLVSGSDDGTLRLWGGETGEAIAVLTGHEAGIAACAFGADGKQVASWSMDGTLRLWDAETGEGTTAFPGHTVPVSAFALNPDGTRIVSGTSYGTLRLWDGETGEVIKVLTGHVAGVTACAFSADGTRVVSGSHDGTLRLWGGETGEAIVVLQGHEYGVTTCAFTPDGTRILSGSSDALCQWNVETAEIVGAWSSRMRGDRVCAFSPDGTRAISGGLGFPRLWDPETGEEIAVLRDNRVQVEACAFSPDGTHAVFGGRDALRLWDGNTGEEVAVLQGHTEGVSTLAFSPDGTRIASGGPDALRLWDVENGRETAVLQGHANGVRTCAFSPDGKRVVSGSDDFTLRLWEVETGGEIAVLDGHTGYILTCAFSPDGTRIVSRSNDNTLRLWDAETGEAVMVFYELPDGGYLVYCAREKKVLGASGNAWRYFRWVAQDRKSYPLLPLEADPRIGALAIDGLHASRQRTSTPVYGWTQAGPRSLERNTSIR